jgi:hypothetical protein
MWDCGGILVARRPAEYLDFSMIWWKHIQAGAHIRGDGHILLASFLFRCDFNPGYFMADWIDTIP